MSVVESGASYQLNDAYIMDSEKMANIKKISNLTYITILDFAKRVAENIIPTGTSSDVFKSIQFISTHTNQPISVKDVAEAIGKSLLIYSEKSISEISEYLCFSSQSYFQNIFKKQYGVTPYNYRKEHRHQ